MDSGCKFCIGGMNVNCVGIDVSKGKSMIAVMRPLGEEGKPYRVYMMASANKFLRIYYATVKQYLDSLEA